MWLIFYFFARIKSVNFDYAGVAKLVDALALGASGRNSMEVQVLSPAPEQNEIIYNRF